MGTCYQLDLSLLTVTLIPWDLHPLEVVVSVSLPHCAYSFNSCSILCSSTGSHYVEPTLKEWGGEFAPSPYVDPSAREICLFPPLTYVFKPCTLAWTHGLFSSTTLFRCSRWSRFGSSVSGCYVPFSCPIIVGSVCY